MKNTLHFLLWLLMVCCWSCSSGGEDGPIPTPTPKPESNKIEISGSNPVVEQKTGTATITFTTNAAWTASVGTSTSWLSVSPASGAAGTHTLTVTAQENDTYDERNATVTIKAGSVSKNITVTQKQKDALIVTSNKVEIGSDGGNFSIEAKANVSLTYEIEEVAKEWITADESRALSTKTLKFNAKANEEREHRQGTITLKGGDGLTETVTVYQEGEKPTLVITSNDVIVGSDGETIKIELKSNVDYTMVLPNVDWITKEESRAISAYTHYLTIAPNESYDQRSAMVYVNNETEGLKDSISITQSQLDAIIVAKNEYEVAPEGGQLDFKVSSNVDFEVSVSVDWIKQNTVSRGLSEKVLGFTIEENEGTENREGEITVSYQQIKQIINIKQKSLIAQKHREALIALYKATNGDNWYYNTNWCSDKPIYEWYGVNHCYGNWTPIESDVVVSLFLGSNRLDGEFPEELSVFMDTCPIEEFTISGNGLYGSIPDKVFNHPKWNELGWEIISQSPYFNNKQFIELDNFNLRVKDSPVTVINTGIATSSHELLKNNKLTVVYQLTNEGSYKNSPEFSEVNINTHLDYHNKGLSTIYCFNKHSSNEELKQWYDNLPDDLPEDILITTVFPYGKRGYHMGNINIYDSNGNLVYHMFKTYCPDEGFTDEWYNQKLDSVLRSHLGEPETHPRFTFDLYTSTDYSRDGEVVTLQTATEGNGITLIFMGEAFVDKDMDTGGLYEQKMKEGMEKFFSMEPYKSLRNRFNVYAVKVVSPNAEWIESAGHRINWSDEVCFEYAQKVPNADKQRPMVSVICNTGYEVNRSYTTIYTDGSFVGYMMDGISNVLIHESGGHGFANLLDEYVELGLENSTLSEDEANFLDNMWSIYSWGANVDWRNDASTVKWSHFLKDSRYANEGLGLYEGAYLYGHGVYRPAENSMMRHNDAPFNAPSREQIYKRVMQLSEGENWKYDYEEFVKFDEKNRNAASRSAIQPLTKAEQQEYIKNHRPPTIIKGTWRDAMKGKGNVIVPLR